MSKIINIPESINAEINAIKIHLKTQPKITENEFQYYLKTRELFYEKVFNINYPLEEAYKYGVSNVKIPKKSTTLDLVYLAKNEKEFLVNIQTLHMNDGQLSDFMDSTLGHLQKLDKYSNNNRFDVIGYISFRMAIVKIVYKLKNDKEYDLSIIYQKTGLELKRRLDQPFDQDVDSTSTVGLLPIEEEQEDEKLNLCWNCNLL